MDALDPVVGAHAVEDISVADDLVVLVAHSDLE